MFLNNQYIFFQVVEEACTNLLPNYLCEYLYDLSEKFTSFYSVCQVFYTCAFSHTILNSIFACLEPKLILKTYLTSEKSNVIICRDLA